MLDGNVSVGDVSVGNASVGKVSIRQQSRNRRKDIGRISFIPKVFIAQEGEEEKS